MLYIQLNIQLITFNWKFLLTKGVVTKLGLNINISIKRSLGNEKNIPRKRVQEEVLEVQEICLGIQESWLDTKKNFTDPVNLWTNLSKNINISI